MDDIPPTAYCPKCKQERELVGGRDYEMPIGCVIIAFLCLAFAGGQLVLGLLIAAVTWKAGFVHVDAGFGLMDASVMILIASFFGFLAWYGLKKMDIVRCAECGLRLNPAKTPTPK